MDITHTAPTALPMRMRTSTRAFPYGVDLLARGPVCPDTVRQGGGSRTSVIAAAPSNLVGEISVHLPSVNAPKGFAMGRSGWSPPV
ncbi:MAG: hypothetical protein ACRDP1_15960 [Nocardioidaceae bacterium]